MFPKSTIPRRFLLNLERSVHKYQFEGVVTLKNPFDLALYMKLISQLKPATIIEIGSAFGGSAKLFSTIARGIRLNTHVYSFDINPVEGKDDDNLSFHYGDIYDLENSALPVILRDAQHPFLVVEDGPHSFEACSASLDFFSPYLRKGDYIVVEDGIVSDFGRGYRAYKDGPNRAIANFLRKESERFVVDREICDFFGTNVTWNTNGYLRVLG